ncbi:helix-turn-helix domain-containing protein [Streptomyces sp. NPDC058195]|uniref:helix-turn-helix domain-containing protein n=1 Tax=Streptomyces sp. NPDC058195 TaxID=3346375 RepID=UPI0036E083D3
MSKLVIKGGKLGGQQLFAVSDDGKPSGSSAGAGRVLGARLRQLREENNLRLSDVVRAGVVGSVATLSRIENALTPQREEKVLALARHYGVSDTESLEIMCELARKSRVDGWWSAFHDAVPGWMERLVSVEALAKSVRTYQMQYIPGLVQTAPYTRALMQAHQDPVMNTAQVQRSIEQRVEVRRIRQSTLQSPSPPQYYAVMDESVLMRRVGGAAVMREQLRHLYNLEENRENVHLRVIPVSRGAEALPPAGSITYLSFPAGREADMLYLEVPDGGTYVTNPGDMSRYKIALTRLWDLAAGRADSMALLEKHIKELQE